MLIEIKDFLNISQAAKLMGVSRQTVYNKIESGELDSFRLAGRIHIDRKDIEDG